MASVNKVILIGNLTRDPELRYTPKNTAVADVGIAVNRRYRVDDEWREEPTYVDVTVWGSQAENASKYLSKGRQVYIEGRLQMDTWEDKNTGQKRSRLRVVAETVQFLGNRGEGGSGGGGGSAAPPRQETSPGPMAPPAGKAPSLDDEESDDIPF